VRGFIGGNNNQFKIGAIAMIEGRSKFTPPQLAALWGVGSGKILGFIKSGELTAVDFAPRGSKRPRYLIDREAIIAFEASRAVKPTGD
jgi:hypothetical protein